MTGDICIQGDFLEGGGQIVRTSLALSVLLGKSFKIESIRKGRKVPGLKAQHLTAIKALKELCSAETNDVALGSEILSFAPRKLKTRMLSVDIGTAGSITLLLQSTRISLNAGG
jgi:RNA 3'-terminal phosphate cyclase (ATP)